MKLPPFQALLDEHRADVYRFCVASAGPGEADDCFQETWIAALRAYPRLRRADNLRAWLFRIAQNKAIDLHRARARRPVPVEAVPETAVAPRRDPEVDRDSELWAAVRALPAEAAHRSVLPHGARDALRGALRPARVHGGRRAGATCSRACGSSERIGPHEPHRRHRGRAARRRAAGRPADARARRSPSAPRATACSTWPSPASTLRSAPCSSAATPRGLVRLSYSDYRSDDEVLEDLARRLSPRILESPGRLDDARRELDEYFDGRRAGFDAAARLVARRAASRATCCARPRASRSARPAPTPRWRRAPAARARSGAAGNALGANPMPVVVPCHRVLRTGGALGGYTGGVERKEFLLRLEGVLA